MKNLKGILVTTTPFVEGKKVKKYLKPVSAHVVAGTDIISDFIAAFSDVFGGRSKTYQRQLASIYNESIERLKELTFELGGNGILGMRVDLDEISGKGKNMFMVTATGTAVVFEEVIGEKQDEIKDERFSVIPNDKMKILRKKKFLIENDFSLDESTWDFITKNRVHEVSSKVMQLFKDGYAKDLGSQSTLYEKLIKYLDNLPEKHRIDLLYNQLNDKSNEVIYPQISKLIKELKVFDGHHLARLLQSEDEKLKRRVLQMVTIEKPFYSKEDLSLFENLVKIIEANFSKIGSYGTEKKLLSKEQEVWVCHCGKKNELKVKYCKTCGLDIYGYRENQINPEKAINMLKETIEIIKEFSI